MKHQKVATCLLFILSLYVAASGQVQAPADTTASTDSALAKPLFSGTEQPLPRPQPKEEAAPRAWVIKSDQIERPLFVDILDLARVVSPVSALDYGSVGQPSPFVFRGLSPQQSKVMLDGIELNNPLNGFPDSPVLPINLVQQIDFISQNRWPAYGQSAPGGILNIETRQIGGQKPYSKVQFRAGDFGYSDLGIAFGLPVNRKTHFLFSGSRQEFDHLFFQKDGVVSVERRDLEDSRFYGTIQTRPNDKSLIQSVTLLNKNEVEIPAPLLPDVSPELTAPRRKNTFFAQQFESKFDGLGGWSDHLQTKLQFSRARQETLNDSLLFDNRSLTFQAAIENNISRGSHEFTFGGNLAAHRLRNNTLLNSKTDGFGYIFFRDEMKLNEKFELGAQVRFEKQNNFAATIAPAVQLQFLTSEKTTFWAGARRDTRYPSFAERFWISDFYRGAPDLFAEKVTNVEAGVLWQPTARWQFEAAAFTNWTQDWITTIYGDSAQFQATNAGTRTTGGIDLTMTWNCFADARLGLNASWLGLRGQRLVEQLQVPEQSVTGFAEYGRYFFERYVFVRLRLDGRFRGRRYGYNLAEVSVSPLMASRSADAVADAKLALIFASATVTISYENLLDRHYELAPGFSMPPRTFRFSIDWEFWD